MVMLPKPSRTARKLEQRATRAERVRHEERAKAAVRRRDKGCRFPLCGCRTKGLRIEVAHRVHKGMGGNPVGDRSTTAGMIQLCEHRHQFGRVSFHAGTLRAEPLTDAGYDGPVAWLAKFEDDPFWQEIARETAPGRIEPPSAGNRARLEGLAELAE